jgi:hypothetical protein
MKFFASQGKRELEVEDDMGILSGNYHWAVSYDPGKKTIRVFRRRDHQVSERTIVK